MMDYQTARNMPPIATTDPQALEKVKERAEAYRVEHQRRKAVNDFYKQVGTLRGCPHATPEDIERLANDLEASCKGHMIPYGKKSMDTIFASIKSFEKRIAMLERLKANPPKGWKFDGGEVVMNHEKNLVQIVHDERPDIDTIVNMKMLGFTLGPSGGNSGAWQRALTEKAIEDTKTLFPESP